MWQGCALNSAPLLTVLPHAALVTLPALYWCCSIIARWNRHSAAFLTGGEAAGQRLSADECGSEGEVLLNADAPLSGSGGRKQAQDFSGSQNGSQQTQASARESLEYRLGKWRRCRLLIEDTISALPLVYMHHRIVKRTVATQGWPALWVSPGLGWLVPMCAGLLLWRLQAGRKASSCRVVTCLRACK